MSVHEKPGDNRCPVDRLGRSERENSGWLSSLEEPSVLDHEIACADRPHEELDTKRHLSDHVR